MKRIKCPNHDERTASFVIYPDGHGFCFGCGYYEAGAEESVQGEDKYVEDVEASIKLIRALPVKPTRGLSFHHNDGGFYIVWPSGDYYKYRLNDSEQDARYRSPVGVKKPLFIAREVNGAPLIIVEGEINAISIALACDDVSVCSPGSANDFTSKGSLSRYLPFYLKHEKILVIGDNDDAGKKASLLLHLELLAKGKSSSVHWMQPDANDLLQQGGLELVRQEVRQILGVRNGMRSNQESVPALGSQIAELGAARDKDGLHGRDRAIHG